MPSLKEKPLSVEIKARGQVTIPKKLRDRFHLTEGTELAIIPIGEALLLASRPLPLEEARRRLKQLMKDSGLTPEELMRELSRDREKLAAELYGKGLYGKG
ncbi:MAG: AbrB/MazE/SpoVT family DNA-binding domain-containing protein [Thermodesulfovibrionales bacterium]|nr:AbrB/MazE/SpoVT family DNA-binding domain-containing protein [Thermodesulfovibrionales bacterium]